MDIFEWHFWLSVRIYMNPRVLLSVHNWSSVRSHASAMHKGKILTKEWPHIYSINVKSIWIAGIHHWASDPSTARPQPLCLNVHLNNIRDCCVSFHRHTAPWQLKMHIFKLRLHTFRPIGSPITYYTHILLACCPMKRVYFV